MTAFELVAIGSDCTNGTAFALCGGCGGEQTVYFSGVYWLTVG